MSASPAEGDAGPARVGMSVLVREGSTERNVDALISGAVREGLPLDNLMFCTDDKHATEIRTEGHINYNVARAIALGVPPVEAVKMGTLNAARHFRLEDEIGSIAPGRMADILLVPDLTGHASVPGVFRRTPGCAGRRAL